MYRPVKVGELTVIPTVSSYELKKEKERLISACSVYFSFACQIHISTSFGPDAEIKIIPAIDPKTNRERNDFTIVVRPFSPMPNSSVKFKNETTQIEWELHILNIVYANVSKGGTVEPLQEAKNILNQVRNRNNNNAEEERFINVINADGIIEQSSDKDKNILTPYIDYDEFALSDEYIFELFTEHGYLISKIESSYVALDEKNANSFMTQETDILDTEFEISYQISTISESGATLWKQDSTNCIFYMCPSVS